MSSHDSHIIKQNYYEKVIHDLYEKKVEIGKHREKCEEVGCLTCQFGQMEELSIEHAIYILRYYQG
jgi:hypothetical protein